MNTEQKILFIKLWALLLLVIGGIFTGCWLIHLYPLAGAILFVIIVTGGISFGAAWSLD